MSLVKCGNAVKLNCLWQLVSCVHNEDNVCNAVGHVSNILSQVAKLRKVWKRNKENALKIFFDAEPNCLVIWGCDDGSAQNRLVHRSQTSV